MSYAPDFKKGGGLAPVVAQDADTGEVLMVAFLDAEAFEASVRTGRAHYHSRSKGRLWMKGESSGHTQEIREILVDCDDDAVVFKVRQVGGAACHTGFRSCFYRSVDAGGQALENATPKVFDPGEVYGGGAK